MCMSTVIPGLSIKGLQKPIANVINNTPIGAGYKAVSGGEKLSDSVRSGKIALGLGTSAMMNQFNKAGG